MQTRLARGAANYLSSQLDTEVSVNKLDFRPFNGFTLDGFLIYDQRKDTLIYSEYLDVEIDRLDFGDRCFLFDNLTLKNAEFNLFRLDSIGTTNLDFLIDYFKSEESEDRALEYAFDAKTFNVQNSRFSYESLFGKNTLNGIDFNSIEVASIDAQFSGFKSRTDSTVLLVDYLHFYEKSGFALIGFQSDLKIDSAGVHADKLLIETTLSQINGTVSLLSEGFEMYSDFLNQVRWDAEFFNSRINLGDIGYFVKDLHRVDSEFLLDGRVRGPISNLSGRDVAVRTGNRTLLKGNVDLNGLPDFTNTFIDLRIKEFSTDLEDLLNISKSIPSQSSLTDAIPQEFSRAGDLFYSGFFTGFPEDFVTYGSLETDAGSFSLDLNFERDTLNEGVNYLGSFEAQRVDAGRLLEIDTLGFLSGSFNVDAFSKETFETAQVKGMLSEFNYSGYRYENIKLDGNLAKKRFAGSLESDDPNLNLTFNGVVDFSTSIPYYDFDATISNLDLSALNMVKLPEELSFSTVLSLDGRGNELENAAGKLVADQTILCYGDSTIAIDKLKLSIFGDSLNRKVSFDSDIVDISITGIFEPVGLAGAFTNMLAEVMPSLATPVNSGSREVFQFSVNYQSNNSISSFLLPGLSISKGTSLYGSFNSDNRKLEMSFLTPGIEYKEFYAKGLSADIAKTGEIFKGRIFANSFWIDSLNFDQPDIDVEAYNDFVDLKLGWFGASGNTSAQLEMHTDFIDKEHFIVELEPGYFSVRDLKWEIDEKATFEKDSTAMTFRKFRVHAGDQTLSINGKIGTEPQDTLSYAVKDFDLTSLKKMGLGSDKRLLGVLNLNGTLKDFYGAKSTEAQGGVSGFTLGEQKIGDLNLSSVYDDKSKNLKLDATLINDGLELVTFHGGYNAGSDDELTGELVLDDFNLDIINEIGVPQVSQFSGMADGRIDVKGLLSKPQLRGYIDFDQARFKIDYLNSEFVFDDIVRVEPDFFGIDYKPLYDSRGTKGYVVASAFHEDYANWSYDISADVENFYILNTSRNDNRLYYGTAFASGTVQLGGYDDKLEVNIDATTENGTEINLPLDEDDEVALENFVHFVNQEEQQEEREVDLSGITMRLNVDATPGASVRIIFDEKAGDILQGSGVGKVTLETTEGGDFNMFGRYEIYSGDYNFTLKNLISKRFTLLPGGTISWYGDPYNADLDLSALYGVRAPLYPIMIENRELYRSRELVNVIMALGGKLETPTIGFQIELPQATENERTQLASAVSTVNQLNQQVFSLLILNKFFAIAAPDQAGTGVVNGLGAVANTSTSEFISNQLSGWLSEISSEFDIGFNYRPGDEITNEEIAVALSTQLFNERLLVSGSFGVTSTNEAQVTEGQSGILGDFLLEYMLTKDGKIRLKVFNETNPYEVFSTSTSMYTQGVGLIYQEDFNTIDEFFKKVGELFKNDEAEGIQ